MGDKEFEPGTLYINGEPVVLSEVEEFSPQIIANGDWAAVLKATSDVLMRIGDVLKRVTKDCVQLIRQTQSNNWLKMHGLPMRRKGPR